MRSSTIRPMFERFAYLCYIALLVLSIGITWIGWMVGFETGDYRAMCVALGGLVLSRWLHVHGHAHWHFQECADSLEIRETLAPIGRPERAEQMAAEVQELFERLETEEDVWAKGELRRAIDTRLNQEPSLREDFADALARHPGM